MEKALKVQIWRYLSLIITGATNQLTELQWKISDPPRPLFQPTFSAKSEMVAQKNGRGGSEIFQ